MRKRRKQQTWAAIVSRDQRRCGIHLGGCGEIISNEELQDQQLSNIGHIIPGVQYNAESFPHLNIQPMHLACNDAMADHYPPHKLIKHCQCCYYIYETAEDGRFQPIHDGNPSDLDNPFALLFTRYTCIDDIWAVARYWLNILKLRTDKDGKSEIVYGVSLRNLGSRDLGYHSLVMDDSHARLQLPKSGSGNIGVQLVDQSSNVMGVLCGKKGAKGRGSAISIADMHSHNMSEAPALINHCQRVGSPTTWWDKPREVDRR